jgi:UDP-galactopyranose mutase
MKRDKFDIVVVGAGISGSVLAERYANTLNKKVLVLEKRPHIGGNCYDFYDKAGILVPLYGPHFFHTNDEGIWQYVSRFTAWYPYEHRVRACVDGKLVPVPVNITTLNMLLGLDLRTEEQAKRWFAANTEKIENPRNSEEVALSRVGKILYEKIFKNYTRKQWDTNPADLEATVMSRIPARTNFDDRYFSDKHQAMPAAGYTKIFEKMLSSKNIEARLNMDYFQVKDAVSKAEKLFFTGPIDAFFVDKAFGKLAYRSLRFEYETLDSEYFQGWAQVNYPNTESFTRITEPKHATGQKSAKTTIIKEYPTWEGEPYYPVPNPQNREIYQRYQREAQKLEAAGVYFVGRLANYKYFNMDEAFKNALDLFYQLEPNQADEFIPVK